MSNKDLSTFLTEWGGQVKELIAPTEQAVEKLEPTLDLVLHINANYSNSSNKTFTYNHLPSTHTVQNSDGYTGALYTVDYTVTGGNGNATVSANDSTGYNDGLRGSSVLSSSGSVGYSFGTTTSDSHVYITIQSAESNDYKTGAWYIDLNYWD